MVLPTFPINIRRENSWSAQCRPTLAEGHTGFHGEAAQFWLDSIEDGFGKHLIWYAQKSNTTTVIADGLAVFHVAR